MAQKKISDLVALTQAQVLGTETIPVVSGSSTNSVTVNQLKNFISGSATLLAVSSSVSSNQNTLLLVSASVSTDTTTTSTISASNAAAVVTLGLVSGSLVTSQGTLGLVSSSVSSNQGTLTLVSSSYSSLSGSVATHISQSGTYTATLTYRALGNQTGSLFIVNGSIVSSSLT